MSVRPLPDTPTVERSVATRATPNEPLTTRGAQHLAVYLARSQGGDARIVR